MSESNGTVDEICQSSVIELAQAGDFRAIAYWLNVYLTPQEIYVRVGADRSGYLLVLAEFDRLPDRDRLLRFICHRLCKLNSNVIEGVRVITKFIGSSEILWDHSVRLVITPDGVQPQAADLLEQSRSPSRIALPSLTLERATEIATESMQWATASLNRLKHHSQQLKKSHAVALGGSAAAAFFIGCGFEALNYSPPTAPTASTHLTPSSKHTAALTQFPSASQPNEVQTAVDKVSVTEQAVLNPDDPTVTLLFSSDTALEQNPPSRQWLPRSSTSRTQVYRQADVAMANLAKPIAQPSSSSETTSLTAQALKDNGIDIVNIANPETLKEGTTALTQTLHSLDQAGIHTVGAGRDSKQARRPEILDVKGQRIAYLGYSGSDLQAASADEASLNFGSYIQIEEDIRAIRGQVDWVVVNFRWNQDLQEQPEDWQVELAHHAIDQGADLVVGHHPDVLQGAEIYKDRVIAYSLGDFIFANSSASHSDYDTAALKVAIRDRQMRLEFLPVQVRQSKPVVTSGEKGTAILKRIEDASANFAQPMRSPMVLDAQISPTLTHSTPNGASDSFISYPSGTEPLEEPDPTSSPEGNGLTTPIAPSPDSVLGETRSVVPARSTASSTSPDTDTATTPDPDAAVEASPEPAPDAEDEWVEEPSWEEPAADMEAEGYTEDSSAYAEEGYAEEDYVEEDYVEEGYAEDYYSDDSSATAWEEPTSDESTEVY